MTEKRFHIKGQVVDGESSQGAPGVRVEVWDKDRVSDDLIGSQSTDHEGRFGLQFAALQFKELFGDRKPDLYFRVYRGAELLVSTEDSVLWNVDKGDTTICIEVPGSGSGEEPANRFVERNERLRLECFEDFDDEVRLASRSFFRRLGAPHLFEERLLPILEGEGSWLFAAVEDRPWPPWGLGAQQFRALLVARRTGSAGIGLSPVFTLDEELTNLGLAAALLREALVLFAEKGDEAVNLAAIEGSVFADSVLCANGFARTGDVFLTEPARYDIYSAEPAKVLASLGLDQVSTLDLLTYEVEWETLSPTALLHSALQLAVQPALRDGRDRFLVPEVNILDWLGFDIAALPPGGVYS